MLTCIYKFLLEHCSWFYYIAYRLSYGMDAASSGRAEVDTSRAFRSVKEAVAVFGERLVARETQLRPGEHADCRAVRERSSWPNAAAIVAAKVEKGGGGRPSGLLVKESLAVKLQRGDGGRPSGLVRESLSKLNAIANAKPWRGGRKPASSLIPVRDAAPSSSPFVAPSLPPLGHDNDERRGHKEAHLMVMNSIKKVEEEAAKTRQEMFQVRKRMAETELAMANLNAKLHHAFSKMAYMEAGRAAAARTSIQQQRGGDMASLTIWAEPQPLRQPLGHLLNLGEETDEEENHGQRKAETTTMTTTVTKKRKVEKEKPIVPLVVPLIYSMLFSNKKKRMKDKENLYMKELYGLLRLT